MFFMRRKRSDAPLDDFDPHNFKHQSVILPDEGVLSRTSSINRTHNEPDERSLNMEQTVAALPPSYGGSYAGYGGEGNYYNHPYSPYQAQYNYGVGQYMNAPSTPTTPYAATPTSATPFMNSHAPYGVIFQAPGSPVTRQPSNSTAQYLNRQPSMGAMQNVSEPATPDAALTRQASMGAVSMLSRAPSTGVGQVLSRQPSVGAEQALNRQPSTGTTLSRQPTDIANASLYRQPSEFIAEILNRQRGSQVQAEQQVGPDAHYVDLSRSSVTPFQAQQYSEISRHLSILLPVANAPAPVAKDNVKDHKDLPADPAQETPAKDTASPFADPEDGGQEVTIPGYPHIVDFPMTPQTDESFGPLPSPRLFATPPSPKYELSLPSPVFSPDRVTSTPPVLPEIHLQERSFSPVAGYPIAPMSAQPSGSFDLPSPLPQAHFDEGKDSVKPDTPTTVRPPSPVKLAPGAAAPDAKRPDTVYSVKHDEDAYDGI
ncbi:hypothetical protein DAEQUDRAFT_766124 [Daedalea quercina L-15889]|uniref:Uncharacterized protein n=1 Tax=Daedalea quercina L-15889 TaxID=1314783 RepID=A0A165PWQ0_9APHY|nr:hypothetical protein DAEQUDRAFT_766124 [Daedalea quercina L-15889]